MNNDMEVILQRISRLERQNRLMKLAGVVLVLGIAATFFYGATTKSPKVIEAQEFRVVDENGKIRVLIGAPDEINADRETYSFLGQPGLALYDKNEHLCTFLGETELVIYRGKQSVRLDAMLTSLRFYDKSGEIPIYLGEGPDGWGLYLWDKNVISKVIK